MHWWFGMDLSSAPFTHHGANQALLTIPYLVLIGMAIFLQYYQMKQMNSRNPQAAAANPQMQQMQKFFPIIFGVIYLRVPAGATIYMVVSSAMRIGTQEYMFRSGMVTPVGAAPAEKATEREIGGASDRSEGRRASEGHRNRNGRRQDARQGGHATEGGADAEKRIGAEWQNGGQWEAARHRSANDERESHQWQGRISWQSWRRQRQETITGRGNRAHTGAQRAPTLAIQEDKKGSIERGVGRSRRKNHRRGHRTRVGPAGRCGW